MAHAVWTPALNIGMIEPMKGFRSSPQARPGGRFRKAVATGLIGFMAATSCAHADLKLPPRPRGDPPMRIVRVMSSDPACEPNCPEWISAEGRIVLGTAGAFRKAIADLGGRRLPILISSHGGSLGDALEMGALIRERGIAVAVARTLIDNCPERAPVCPAARGQAITGGAFCASACPLILAAGVERLVGPVPMVGVHQITEVMKDKEGAAQLTTIKKIYEPGFADATVERYLAAMGVGDPVMSLLRKTPAASIRWLSLAEMSASHMATELLDAAAPVLTTGANGLNGRAFEGDPPRPDPLIAKATASLPQEGGGQGVRVEASLTYRRGGGAVEVALDAHEPAKPSAGAASAGWTLAGAGDPVRLESAGLDPARAAIPRERFCVLARDGKLVLVSPDTPPQQPVTLATASMEGFGALTDEACPQ